MVCLGRGLAICFSCLNQIFRGAWFLFVEMGRFILRIRPIEIYLAKISVYLMELRAKKVIHQLHTDASIHRSYLM
jgi:hypothetical protein